MQPRDVKTDDMVVSGGGKKRSGFLNGKQMDDAPVNGGWKDQADVPSDEVCETCLQCRCSFTITL